MYQRASESIFEESTRPSRCYGDCQDAVTPSSWSVPCAISHLHGAPTDTKVRRAVNSGVQVTPRDNDAHFSLEKHREIVAVIEQLDDSLAGIRRLEQTSEGLRVQLVSKIRRLTRDLESYFEAEQNSLKDDFDDDPELRSALRDLDRDHPKILSGFQSAIEILEGPFPTWEVVSTARGAIEMFRRHEENEAALFGTRG